jgi:hypothetical protein
VRNRMLWQPSSPRNVTFDEHDRLASPWQFCSPRGRRCQIRIHCSTADVHLELGYKGLWPYGLWHLIACFALSLPCKSPSMSGFRESFCVLFVKKC